MEEVGHTKRPIETINGVTWNESVKFIFICPELNFQLNIPINTLCSKMKMKLKHWTFEKNFRFCAQLSGSIEWNGLWLQNWRMRDGLFICARVFFVLEFSSSSRLWFAYVIFLSWKANYQFWFSEMLWLTSKSGWSKPQHSREKKLAERRTSCLYNLCVIACTRISSNHSQSIDPS